MYIYTVWPTRYIWCVWICGINIIIVACLLYTPSLFSKRYSTNRRIKRFVPKCRYKKLKINLKKNSFKLNRCITPYQCLTKAFSIFVYSSRIIYWNLRYIRLCKINYTKINHLHWWDNDKQMIFSLWIRIQWFSQCVKQAEIGLWDISGAP